MLRVDREQIAAELHVVDAAGLGNGRALSNWLRVLNYVRNICAHHSRLWNRNLADQLATRHVRAVPELAHLAQPGTSHQNARPFAAFSVIAFLLRHVAADDRYVADLRALMATSLPAAKRTAWEMGFPDGWEGLPLWTA
ncbi:MAG TPA: Abi family protein [Jatrophihabitans sp.]|jgi:abortive infection bacteriophage resistance protein|uniref:Abi family protein n=1 Tax=Jatrophihabitans sp. TaxID=1932789 RepID=UPI002EFA664B